jgi:hypothetical protein
MAEERAWQRDLSRKIKLKVHCAPHAGVCEAQGTQCSSCRCCLLTSGSMHWSHLYRSKCPVDPLQEAALAALPPKLREAADTPDMTPFPLERMVPTHTPPIKGFGDRGRNQKLQQ